MRVLVTGGAGFVGANLCIELLDRGHDVVVVDDLSTGYKSNLVDVDVDFREHSILDTTAMLAAARRAEVVVHLAARGSVPRSLADPLRTNEVNVLGTLSVLETARSTGARVIVASSSSVYGANLALPKHDGLVPMPVSPYAVSKLATESYALAYGTSFGLSSLVFRFFNIFGPLQSARHAYAAVIPSFISAMLDGDPVRVHGDGHQSRDFTSVDTVCRVLATAVEDATSHPRPVNLAYGTNTTLEQLIDELEQLVGVRAEIVHEPDRTGDVRASQADASVLRHLFPTIEPTPLGVGLSRTVEWFQRTGGLQT